MSGKTNEVLTLVILGCGLIAAGSDLARGKIPNWLTFTMMLGGLALGAVTHGAAGALSAFIGIAGSLLMYGWMFPFGLMGAGDVKLLMGFGAILGIKYAAEIALLAILVGGVFAFVQLAFAGRLRATLEKIWRMLVSLAVKELKLEVPKVDRKLKMPFGVAIALAAVLVQRGVHIWTLFP